MVLRQIGKNTRGEVYALDFLIIKRVRGNLHNHVFHTANEHIRKHLVEFNRIGRRKACGQFFIRIRYPQRTDYPHLFARLAQYTRQHMRCGRFAVCARNSYHF